MMMIIIIIIIIIILVIIIIIVLRSLTQWTFVNRGFCQSSSEQDLTYLSNKIP